MLDLRRIREETDLVKDRLSRRGNPAWIEAVDRVIELDERRRTLVGEVDGLRARRNEESQRVATLKREKKHEEADRIIASTRALGDRVTGLETELGGIEGAIRELLLGVPNLPDEVVPAGGESDNRMLREWGAAPSFAFTPRPHWELGEDLGILDLPRGAKVAGSGFPLLRGLGARLERGLISFMMDLHANEHGYTELWPPFVINREAATGTGHLPKFGEDMYEIPLDGLWLVPTAEVPVTNIHAGELLPPGTLPLRYVAYTPCFRREAGSHGKDTRGLLRLHQFDKVELVRFEKPEDSEAALEELTGHAESVLQRLGLRYRVVLLAAGDLGFANARTYDLEVWAPGVGTWLEVSSCSRYTDYQARRTNVRYRPDASAKPEYLHTLNGSALALARLVVALLETYQQADGSVVVPEPLRPYLHTDRIVAP